VNEPARSAKPKRSRSRSPLALEVAPVRVDIAGLSHVGRVRSINQDHFLIVRLGRFLRNIQTNIPDEDLPPSIEEGGTAMVVADGIGGQPSGDRASKLAIRVLLQLVIGTSDWLFLLDDDLVHEVLHRARERGAAVDAVLSEMAKADPKLKGFGTTMTAAFNNGRDLFVTSIGDSRAYLMRGGQLRALTRDHTIAQELADQGRIEPTEVKTHPFRHTLTRALGHHGGTAELDVQGLMLEDGDGVLLCTDGLTDMVKEAEIAEILKEGGTAKRACRDLVDSALTAGGADNVTAVVAFYRIRSRNDSSPDEGRFST
jgi:PPM family protein phosphatase